MHPLPLHLLIASTLLTSFSMSATAAENTPPSSGRDAHALAVVATADRDEIAAAKQAQTKKLGADTMAYAKMLQNDHQANLDQTRALAAKAGKDAAPSDKDAMHKKDAQTLADLAKLDGDTYEKAYLDAMVKGHTEVLAKLDNDLVPKASDPAVKDHLSKTREAVAAHLEKAKALQGQH
jgi:putative membrane protein